MRTAWVVCQKDRNGEAQDIKKVYGHIVTPTIQADGLFFLDEQEANQYYQFLLAGKPEVLKHFMVARITIYLERDSQRE